MIVEKGRVRAPEIGRVWLNSAPLNLRQLRGKVILIDFWDYTCVNCVRTLPYVQGWHQRYGDMGLVVIGIHTPEFTFAQYESNVERGIQDFGLTYPIVIDSNFELWQAFANRYWPAKYIIDKDGYIRFAHFGEGAYAETEEQLQNLLREVNPEAQFPPVMQPVRESDVPGAVCYQPTPELYLGHRRGRIGNEGGFVQDETSNYGFDGDLKDQVFYLRGRWHSTAEYVSFVGGEGSIVLRYEAAAVNLVMGAGEDSPIEVEVQQDGRPLTQAQATPDIRISKLMTFLRVDRPRMYSIVDNHSFGVHLLELRCKTPGLRAYAFTFTSCVDRTASTAQSGSAR